MSRCHSTSTRAPCDRLLWPGFYPDEEFWLPIPDCPGYEVSSHARLRSYWAGVGIRCVLMSSPQCYRRANKLKRGGHLVYAVPSGGKTLYRQIGFWMLSAFVCPWPGKGWYCCHRDGVSTNNDLGNLRWDTKRADGIDRVVHGTHPLSKMKVETVREIRRLIAGGMRDREVAHIVGTHYRTVQNIRRRVTFTWVD